MPSRLFLRMAKGVDDDRRRAQRNSATFSKADRSGAMLGAWGMIDPLIIPMAAVLVSHYFSLPESFGRGGVC